MRDASSPLLPALKEEEGAKRSQGGRLLSSFTRLTMLKNQGKNQVSFGQILNNS